MEPREKPKDANDPREYEATHGGAPRAFLLLVVIPILYVVVAAVCVYGMRRGPAVGAVIALGMLLTMTAVLVLLCTVVTDRQGVSVWLRAYWCRNVRGYRLACLIERPFPSGSSAGSRLRYRIIHPGEKLADDAVTVPTFVLPLGGWFRRPTVAMPKDRSGSAPKRGQIQVLRLELLHQDGTERAIAGSVMQLSDRHGNRFTVTVWQAIEIFEKFGARLLNDSFQGLMSVVGCLKNDCEQLARERDAARQEREEATAFIAELDRRFEESSRLHDKLQALRIWERVRQWLYFHRFPTAWETPAANAHQQHDADACALAEVRARIKEHERRDRIRHRKGATAAT